MATDSPEQLLNSFKAAALSVTKLYRSATAAESKAREDGYQDCISDLLAFLDRENIGLGDGEGWRIRRWATEKLNGETHFTAESEDDDITVAEPHRNVNSTNSSVNSSNSMQISSPEGQTVNRHNTITHDTLSDNTDSGPVAQNVSEPVSPQSSNTFIVPTVDKFTFQSSISYPDINQLDLSDSTPPTLRNPLRSRLGNAPGAISRTSAAAKRIGYGAGHKRKINLAEIFDIGDLTSPKNKDVSGNNSKRNRLI